MEKLNLLAEYKELYYKEIENKNTLNGKIGTSITLITVLCTGQIFIVGIMAQLDLILKTIPIIFFLLELTSAILTIATLYFFLKTYYKYNYDLVSIEEINRIISYNQSLKGTYQNSEIENANYEFLKKYYMDTTIKNRKQNLIKNKFQLKLSTSISLSMVSLFLTYLFWVILIQNKSY